MSGKRPHPVCKMHLTTSLSDFVLLKAFYSESKFDGRETPTPGIEPGGPEGRGLAIRCNTAMRCGLVKIMGN